MVTDVPDCTTSPPSVRYEVANEMVKFCAINLNKLQTVLLQNMYQNPNNQTQNPGILPGRFNDGVAYLEILIISFPPPPPTCKVLSSEDEQIHFDSFFEVR